MLFNSYEFIFLFMPVAIAGFAWLSATRHAAALLWLTALSLLFYANWDWHSLWILAASIILNFASSLAIDRSSGFVSKCWLIFGVACNLFALGIFKYAAFATEIFNGIAGTHLDRPEISLPLGISFFTFTQIAYLVDVYRRLTVDRDPARYALFVSYFPHLIAGPILHHKPTMEQLADPNIARLRGINWIVGLTFFSIGLSKKLLLADPLGAIASPLFEAARTVPLSSVAAWIATLAYTFQLYFDFSGYSDMAMGLSLLFGVRIPINFMSPYKATSIIEFWRCWHMSLSNFLRDYLYIPLGGSRRGPVRRYINLFLTMLLGGLWHGASWNFVIWGGLHGVYLLVNHAWRRFAGISPGPLAGSLLTFLAVMIGWVFFRSANFATAQGILTSMASLSQLGGWSWGGDPQLAAMNIWRVVSLLSVAAVISFLLPNSVQITDAILRGAQNDTVGDARLVSASMAAFGLLFGLGVVSIGRVSPFLYFQF
jgi:D-alanyl-lipoteichoic acid acyltransferase DltB (MBOAT superfamily)